ncbi:phosphatidylinositol 3,4,5-trisphosphate 3-phosphatase TPTE2 isoform X2 [Lepeophtheirus salmonis]|uniref:phosphatidylinositol 3,4,5-trisphosphate 3-phosphatase TPTE2 isoform X2 n=1 Tax=Lepeophtheirus salmonis TaxID=72036 RepID=UPI001AE5330E|nr:phosphatidylinositol 3,4,5-trisphosphate 3-phosphatase TPTE2-like isoform X2 [Lepeophtheirus salmonis]XP_040580126.1 phosphatidylinositol 3,4,5-trisphosphate 3-phosphatase TPTE2-like isoform X2 [Lepeophtheirus salmonis]
MSRNECQQLLQSSNARINNDPKGNGKANGTAQLTNVMDSKEDCEDAIVDISLDDDSNPNQVISRAADFFLENNDNYRLTWDEASHRISENEQDPSKPPVPGINLQYVNWRLRRMVESIYFRIFTLLLILIDLIVIVVDLSTEERNYTLLYIDFGITVYFVFEIILRIIALTVPLFFSHWYNVVDFAVVLITFIVVTVSITGQEWSRTLAIFVVFRFIRILRLIRLYTEKKQLETATRQFISQNKRRYQQDGYDLDLTYVTARVIATSFPSSGMWAWYRNPIEKVASFLDKKHHGKYKLYNLCSEKTYDVSFFHSRVERFMIDDHNVPSLSEMLRFAENVREWFDSDPDNVIVVHCKGGKGRTGTMICVWLVESGVFTSADQSLDYFGSRRTDTNVSKKFQGVETPSQSRYVRYFELMKTTMGGRIPEPRPLLLKEFTISGMSYVGAGDGSDFWFSVDQGRGNRVFSANMSFNRNCVSDYDSGKDILKIQILNSPILDGDIRVVFQTSSKIVPKGYEECPFYFWFNTAFINIDTGLFLSREELDNPHKPKTWSTFRDNFSVQAGFALP